MKKFKLYSRLTTQFAPGSIRLSYIFFVFNEARNAKRLPKRLNFVI